jgi:cyclopropane-fatty-acyl-phospholipid synthase
MTVTARVGSLSTIDSARWPHVARVPWAPLRARIAASLCRRTFQRLPLRVVWPDATVTGGGARTPR